MQTENQIEETEVTTGSATYCPEDNKLRLYIGRVPREEYLTLKAAGWKPLYKQREAGKGDFVATWTPSRYRTALRYGGGIVDDEDSGPEERAADRAERFGGYADKRADEAGGHADRFDSGPAVHGFQNYGRAVRAADRHDRIAGRAVDAWEKAEYWQRRTAGVIAHALYVSSPAVRMGRIKTLEAEQRKHLASLEEYKALWEGAKRLEGIADPEKQTEAVRAFFGSRYVWAEYMHPRAESQASEYRRTNKLSLWSLMDDEKGDGISGAEALALFFSDHGAPCMEDAWTRHYALRLAYENQMLEAQGGRAAFVEMEVGGWIGEKQIRKVNKSNATGRVVSVEVMGKTSGFTRESGYKEHATWACPKLLNVERLPVGAYRAPTAEDKAALAATLKAEKAARPAVASVPLVNPTDEDAERLQAIWNERAADEYAKQRGAKYMKEFEPAKVVRVKQATYSAASSGSYARAETRNVSANAELWDRASNMYCADEEKRKKAIGPAVCKVRVTSGSDSWPYPRSVVVITDKPQKALPAAVWKPRAAVAPPPETCGPCSAAVFAGIVPSKVQGVPDAPAPVVAASAPAVRAAAVALCEGASVCKCGAVIARGRKTCCNAKCTLPPVGGPGVQLALF